jgi:hypothetical protein
MDRRTTHWVLVPALLLCSPVTGLSQDQDTSDTAKQTVAILEIAGATSTSLRGERSSFGPNIAVEITPIENWLELEMGVTPLFRPHHSAEWNTDLLFKKPWDVSRQFEFMVGLGPEWVHTKEPGANKNSIAGEAVIDLMFWPGQKRRFGMFIEPRYDYNFARGHEQSFGITAGLLIALR